jgi:hypothetical protein
LKDHPPFQEFVCFEKSVSSAQRITGQFRTKIGHLCPIEIRFSPINFGAAKQESDNRSAGSPFGPEAGASTSKLIRAMDFESIYRQIGIETHALAQMGFDLQTFIPAVLDPNAYPKRDGKGEAVISKKTGHPEPAFCGKNPSFWNRDGKPILAKPNQPCSLQDAIQRIDVAKCLKKPIGIGVIPKEPVVVIDIDKKCYDSNDEMNADIKRIIELHPQLRRTRVESTPSGGWHILLRVNNMSDWRQLNGSLHCNFSTFRGGPHRGEILTGGNRFCASAPSMRNDGYYQVHAKDAAYNLIEIESLSTISIYPTVQKENNPPKPRTLELNSREVPDQPLEHLGSEEDLLHLLTEKSQRVLQGDLPFKADDRSGTLAALGHELFSWNNLAADYGYDFTGALETVWQDAVVALDAEDKGNRVFQSLNSDACFSEQDWADQRFTKVMKIGSQEPIPQMKEHSHPQAVSSRGGVTDVTVEDALNELIRLSSVDLIDAKKLMSPLLCEALSVIGETIEYDWEVILTVLMVGISGALPLDSKIELIPGDFSQPLVIWAVLLMSTGELKSPLIKRLLLDPWKTSVDTVMNQRYQDAVKEWNRQRTEESANGGDFEIPKPKKVQTMITEDRTSQGIERHFMLHERFARGSVLLVLDEAKDILLEMTGQSSGTSTLPFGTWILPRYDGTGARGAKADEQYERHYFECRLAALFCCQPEVYRAITGDADQTGLAARFVAVEQNTVDQQFPTAFPDSHKRRHESLRQILSDLYTFVCSQSSIHLELTDDALALFQKERQHLQDRKNQTLSNAERGLLNKCHGRIGRFAGIFHLQWSFNPRQPHARLLESKVGVDAMQRAIDLNRYLLSQTVLVRQTSSGNSVAMQKILAFHNTALKVKKMVRITELRVQPASANRLSPPEAEMVAQALQKLDYGRVSTDEKGKLCYQALKPLSA